MLDTLITSKTRVKILLKFFLNAKTTGHLKKLAAEFNESSNGLRVELNKLEGVGLLQSKSIGNKKIFSANTKHPMYENIHKIIFKYVGVEQIVESVIGDWVNFQVYILWEHWPKGLIQILLISCWWEL